ncbi:MAG: NAD-dependent protein deacylase [Oscillospiraceae bacterium]|nr:NAD-dependent protein deacylase [Oscillospiraceae bacterium]
MNEAIKTLKTWIEESDNIVFFGGAGVSTESGIKDFRSVDGLYHMKFKYPPETMLSHSFYKSHTEEFYDFYRNQLMPPDDIQPNTAHLRLAELEREGKLRAVVTQNVDGLHEKAGSKRIYNLHGSIYRNRCVRCGKRFDGIEGANVIRHAKGVPLCDCGGIIKPDVVLYEEGLDEDCINGAVDAISKADMLIVGGTSLTVYPASGLIRYYRGKRLVLINRDETPYDSSADLVIREPIGQVFGQV